MIVTRSTLLPASPSPYETGFDNFSSLTDFNQRQLPSAGLHRINAAAAEAYFPLEDSLF
jgi:hypothetical protein